MKYLYISLTSLIILIASASAQKMQRVPASPYPITIVQPNGKELTIRLHGDEHQHFTTTTDGYVIVENKDSIYCFGRINTKGEIIASRYKATNENNRSKRTNRYLKRMAKNPRLKKDMFVF